MGASGLVNRDRDSRVASFRHRRGALTPRGSWSRPRRGTAYIARKQFNGYRARQRANRSLGRRIDRCTRPPEFVRVRRANENHRRAVPQKRQCSLRGKEYAFEEDVAELVEECLGHALDRGELGKI